MKGERRGQGGGRMWCTYAWCACICTPESPHSLFDAGRVMQDVIQCGPFAQTVLGQMRADPGMVPALLAHVGPGAMADWLKHFSALVAYDIAWKLVQPYAPQLLQAKEGDPKEQFKLQQRLQALRFGSGNDYHG